MSFLDELETGARVRAMSLHAAGKLPHPEALGYDRLTATEARELARLKHAGAAASDADTYVALCRGQAVHPSRLNSEHVRLLHLEGERQRMGGRDGNG